MISGIGSLSGTYSTAFGSGVPVQNDQKRGGEELTTVTTHCGKDHRHTPACPHTVYTRPVDETQRRGKYIDLYA